MKRSKYVVFALLAGMVFCAGARPACAETTWYVDDDGPADFATIQAAIDASSDGDTIIVRDGYYTGDGNRDIDFNGKAVHLKSENEPENCVIDCQGTQAEPHRGFYFHSGEDENSIVDGFTITNGYAGGSEWEERSGGGIYCFLSSPTITNNTITGNTASSSGGGIYCSYTSSPTIANNSITGNTATSGGGIYCTVNSSPTITNNTITGNTATRGGGIYCSRSSSPTIANNTITANTADGYGGAGGGIYCSIYSSSPTIINNTITGNTAYWGDGIYCRDSSPTIANNTITGNGASSGGGIYCISRSSPTIANNTITGNSGGGGISCRENSSPTIMNNTITGNTARDGGGILCYDNSSPTITNNTITGNTASSSGGGIYCSYTSSPTIANNSITGNTATSGGGGIYCRSDSSPTITNNTITGNTATSGGGGGIYCSESSPTIANNTITGNTANLYGSGGGIYCRENSSPTITNNTITGNGAFRGGGIYCENSSPTIANNTITGNTATSGGGGGILCENSSPTIANNMITGNTARDGGGIRCRNNSSPTITNNTITGNTAVWGGGGIYCSSGSSLIITNSILWGNSALIGAEIYLSYSSLTVRYSDVPGGAAAAYFEPSPTLDLDSTNIDADPVFADLDNGDYHLKSQAGRWDPVANEGAGGWVVDDVTSPCIDTGDPASDYSSEPLPNDGRINMGAYGNTGEASKSSGYFLLAVTTSGSGTGTVKLSPSGGLYDEGTTVTVTAQPSPGSFFDHWEGDLTGSDNPATILMDAHKSVVAHFIYPQLSVLSAPIGGVAITGTRAGTTPYSADCDLHEDVTLTAPESVSVGGKTYYFAYWSVDNVPVPPSEGLKHLEVTMDDRRTALAQYDWRLPGDYNDDCTVNILDLLFVRNRLQTRCSE